MSDDTRVRIFINDEGVEMCYCSREQTYHPCSRFGKNKHSATGLQYLCKDCLKNVRKERVGNDYMGPQSEVEKSREILKRMGYDLDSEIPVHIQHQQRVNERLRKRTEIPSNNLPPSR